MNTLATEMRFCADIGMFALDREISTSCVHRTEFCETECFNNKLFKVYPAMHQKDKRNEMAWADNDYAGMAKSLNRRKKFTDRVRFMTRGETFKVRADIKRAKNIAVEMPEREFWVPTRAWRDMDLMLEILEEFKGLDNVFLMASMDTSNTKEDWVKVKYGFSMSTMFFGDNKQVITPNGDRSFICPKTHKHLSGHCAICKGGCFRKNKRVDVHLKQH